MIAGECSYFARFRWSCGGDYQISLLCIYHQILQHMQMACFEGYYHSSICYRAFQLEPKIERDREPGVSNLDPTYALGADILLRYLQCQGPYN